MLRADATPHPSPTLPVSNIVTQLCGSSSGIAWGDWATWFSGVMTALVFVWTLNAWRLERRHVRRLEQQQIFHEVRSQAGLVALWVQQATTLLRDRSGTSKEACPDGTWVACIQNEANYALYEWEISLVFSSPKYEYTSSERERGTIGPRGSLFLLPIARVPKDARPKVKAEIAFIDDRSNKWRRNESGLSLETHES